MDELQPNVETITHADGGVYERVIYPDGHAEMRVVRPPLYPPLYNNSISAAIPDIWEKSPASLNTTSWSMQDYADLRKFFESKEGNDVTIIKKQSPIEGEHIVLCNNEQDLSAENVLKTLSAIKGRLMIDVVPIRIKTVECSITPQVRKNIVTASKRLKMYGKKRPIIARFDEYGNRLPDEIDLGSTHGITLKIIDPEKYGEYYFELKGTEFSNNNYYFGTDYNKAYTFDPDDLLFKKL